MKYRDAMVKFLSQKENLEYALEIADHIGEVKNRIFTSFWDGLAERLRGKAIGWTVERNLQPQANNTGVYLVPPPRADAKASVFAFRVQQELKSSIGNMSFFLAGVRTLDGNPMPGRDRVRTLEPARQLISILNSHDKNSNERWLGWKRLSRDFDGERNFLLNIGDSIIDLFADEAIALFEETRLLILELNDAL